MDKVNMTKDKNRRVSFRIYEEVDLFYQKIDEELATESHSTLETVLNKPLSPISSERLSQDLPASEKNLPDALMPDFQFKENETCDVNISESGMAFYCVEAFKEGDYLAFKVLLPSSKATIVACGKVVNCKDSNPYESHEPYQVRVHFINLEDEGRELLSKHVHKKKVQQLVVNGFILAAVVTFITVPDVVFGLLFELLHLLFEHVLEFLHLAFEFIELNLDKLIEHFFETGLHETQVIVFYIIAFFVLIGFYRLCRTLPRFYRRCKKNLILYCSRKKASWLFYWREQSLFNKIKLVVIAVAAISGYVFFGM